MLEKILRSLPHIKTIYLAIKPNVSVDVIYFTDERPQLGVQAIPTRNNGVPNFRQTQAATWDPRFQENNEGQDPDSAHESRK